MAIQNSNVKRPMCEEGIIVEKFIAPERQAGEYNGRPYPARPETPTVKVMSSYLVDNSTGIKDGVILDYEVTKDQYDKLKFLDKVKVMYTHSVMVRDGKTQDIFADKQILSVIKTN